MMRVELSRFQVKQGKSERVDEWLKMLNINVDEVLQTLEREQLRGRQCSLKILFDKGCSVLW